MSEIKEKKKRGRKSNAEKKLLLEASSEANTTVNVPKKRGRKPKGGKIIENNNKTENNDNIIPNIILHLKCNNNDIETYNNNDNIESFNINNNKNSELSYLLLNNNNNNNQIIEDNIIEDNIVENKTIENKTIDNKTVENNNNLDKNSNNDKEIYDKLKELQFNLHTNNISDKKSACFWCTYDFDNPPIYIPKYLIRNTYHCYGCFCSPECSVAYLFNENIDSAVKFERYHLSNLIYSKIYNYEKNIKPAPNPYYILDKFYGNLSITEYRQLLTYDRLLFVIDKPLTRILPELHKDNDDFLLSKNISYNNLKIKKSNTSINISKNDIMNENFGF